MNRRRKKWYWPASQHREILRQKDRVLTELWKAFLKKAPKGQFYLLEETLRLLYRGDMAEISLPCSSVLFYVEVYITYIFKKIIYKTFS